ncbi:MAG: 50S ribosomal protein L18e [Candidatus Pacearchaeota archaeon]
MISKTRINKKAQRKNEELKHTILALKKQKNKDFLKIARYLVMPRKKSIAVNLERINKLCKDDDVVLIPGKILSKGSLNKKIQLVAFKVSGKALEKIRESGSSFCTMNQFLNEKEKKFKIIV